MVMVLDLYRWFNPDIEVGAAAVSLDSIKIALLLHASVFVAEPSAL